MISPPTSARPDARSSELLQARSLAGIFDGAFDLYKRYFITIAMIVAVVYIPLQIGLHAVSDIYLLPIAKCIEGKEEFTDVGPILTLGFASLFTGNPGEGVPGFLSFLTLVFVSVPVTVAVAELSVGRSISIREAYLKAAPSQFALLGAWMLIALAMLFILFVGIVVISIVLGITLLNALRFMPEVAVVLFALVATLLPYCGMCAIFAQFFFFTTPLMVLERLSFSAAISRNTQLVGKNRFLRVWLAAICLPMVVYGLRMLILSAIGGMIETLRLPPFPSFLANTALSSGIHFFFEPYWMLVVTLLYFDSRIAREGYDVQVLSENLLSVPRFLPEKEQQGEQPS